MGQPLHLRGLLMILQVLLLVAAGAAQAVAPPAAWPDPVARAGRLSDVQGSVLVFDPLQGQWTAALRNRPLVSGDRLATQQEACAEVRIGSTELRLGSRTELEIVDLDGERLAFRLATGSLAVRLRAVELARQVEVQAAGVRVLPQRAGHYRIDREDDVVQASAWRGALQVATPDQLVPVLAGRRAEFMWEPRNAATIVTWSAPAVDGFADWVARDEQRDERSASAAWVSPEMTGVEDLDRHGRWERHPEYGMVWTPLVVTTDWAPFRHGSWVLHARRGWIWVDAAPWGFAPSHYGRWLWWGGRWAWWPGPSGHRPVLRHEPRHAPGVERPAPAPVVVIPSPPPGRPVHPAPRVDGPPLPRPRADASPPPAPPVVAPAPSPRHAPAPVPAPPRTDAPTPTPTPSLPPPPRGNEPGQHARPLPVEPSQGQAPVQRGGRTERPERGESSGGRGKAEQPSGSGRSKGSEPRERDRERDRAPDRASTI
ncbi:MAG: DUF6600 domain-containing protein [Rubrivivax sp.]